MNFKFWQIPALAPEQAESELNAFIGAHRVLSMERQFVACGAQSFWSICMTLSSQSPGVALRQMAVPQASKIDYREVLTPEQFEIFVRLRECRKQLAQREGVPVYGVLTNEQMAKVATERPTSLAALGQIDGLGAARLEKYGSAILALVAVAPAPQRDV